MINKHSFGKYGLLVVALLLVLSACAPTSSTAPAGEGVATLDDVNAPATSPSSGEELSPEEAMRKYESCLAENGVDLNAGGDGLGGGQQVGDDAASDGAVDEESFDFEQFEAAEKKCGQYLDGAGGAFDLSPEQEAALRDAELAWNKCMKERGVDVGPIGASGETLDSDDNQSGLGIAAIAEEDFEEFEKAASECEQAYAEFEELVGEGGEGQ